MDAPRMGRLAMTSRSMPIGLKKVIDAVGVKEVIDTIGMDRLFAELDENTMNQLFSKWKARKKKELDDSHR